jgi:hypothetical protein
MAVSEYVSKKLRDVAITASQEEFQHLRMTVSEALKSCDDTLEEERRMRKLEIADLISSVHETLDDAITKLRDELSTLMGLHHDIIAPKLAENMDVNVRSQQSALADYADLVTKIQSIDISITSLAKGQESVTAQYEELVKNVDSIKSYNRKSDDALAQEIAYEITGVQDQVTKLACDMDRRETLWQELHSEVVRACSQSTATTLQLGQRIDEAADHVRTYAKGVLEMSGRIEALEGERLQRPPDGTSRLSPGRRVQSQDQDDIIAQLSARIDAVHEKSSGMQSELIGLVNSELAVSARSRLHDAHAARQRMRLEEVCESYSCISDELSAVHQYAESVDARMLHMHQESWMANVVPTVARESPTSDWADLQRSLRAEKVAREADTARIIQRIEGIVSGKDPRIETAFERLAAEIRASCMIAVREEMTRYRGMELPRAGEQWIFTGNISNIDVFSSMDGKNKVHGLACCGPQGRLRRIDILTTVVGDQQYVHFKGTHNMNFLEGYVRMREDDGRWNVQKFDPSKFDRDTWL